MTIALDDETARWVRVEAARKDVSVSRYLAELLAERRQRVEGYASARAAFMAREPQRLREPGASLPPREELHERGGAR